MRPRPATNIVDNHTPVGCEPLASGRRKRSFARSSLEGREDERSKKKHKPSNFHCDCASGGAEVKSKRSREMVGRKFRRLDSIGKYGVLCVHSLRRKQSDEICESEEENRAGINDSSGGNVEEGAKERLGGPAEVCRIEGTMSHRAARRKKAGKSANEACSDEWTEEHLQEPRKKERRKSLDELQARDAPFLSWARKAKRRPRTGVRNVNTNVETIPVQKTLESIHIPREETIDDRKERRSLVTSGDQPLSSGNLVDFQLNTEVIRTEDARGWPSGDCINLNNQDDSNSLTEKLDTTNVEGSLVVMLRETTTSHSDSLASEKDHGALQSSLDVLDGARKLNADIVVDNSKGTSKVLESPCASKGETGSSPVLEKAFQQSEAAMADSGIARTDDGQMCNTGDSAQLEQGAAVHLREDEVKLNLIEGRRCGLCGGGSDGEPPDSLLPVSKNIEDQAGGCEKTYPGYSEWDAFGNEPGWLGRLLGPLSDRFGIAGVWVHQECAIWSPEVYFAGVGRMKNLRAALRRGRLLKCSRCAKPGATIGCRIDRCPRTYHLPCARFEGCFFDHKKYLMACDEHLHLFLPRLPGHRCHRNNLNVERIRFKRMVGERKRVAQKAFQLDLEIEEKWQEKAGVDEDFLRHERRRLQRDLARVAPVMVGGPDAKQNVEGWESVAGLQNVIQCMKEMVILPLLYPEAFDSLGVLPPRGVLLHGHPGTGKTLAVRALVGACAKGHKRIAYFARKGADCLSKYVGDAERQLRLLFHLAEKHQPSIIFFDEIDGLAPTRSQHQDQTQKSVVSTLLALMDGIKSRGSVIVIGATNRPDALDPALRRPGRFDREIYFPLPTTAERAAIFTLFTKNWPVPPTRDVISLLASHTPGFAGADLQALSAQAAMNSLKRSTPIENLLAFVEKHCVDELPPLPELSVNLIDWAAALEQVSPPCSCRAAKASVNIVPNAPLLHHMVPALLWPMFEIIMSLHLDPRVILPPMLEKVAATMEAKLKADLEGGSMTCLLSFLHCNSTNSYQKRFEKDLENAFHSMGLIAGGPSSCTTKQAMPESTYSGSRFRIMISGEQISSQKYLAAWILYGFEGFAEMSNLSLATMLQDGDGDAIQGLIQILENVQRMCPCVVYMPQLETWAVELMEESLVGGQRQASQSWSVFLEHVNSLPADLRIVFVAHCGLKKDDMPLEIVEFFSGTSLSLVNPSSSSNCLMCDSLTNLETPEGFWLSCCRSIPCSWVQVSLLPEMKVIFRRAADDYAEFLSARLLYNVNRVKRAAHTSKSPRSCKLDAGDVQITGAESLPRDCKEKEHGYDICKKDSSRKADVFCDADSNEMSCDATSSELMPAYQEIKKPSGVPERKSPRLSLPGQNITNVAICMVGYQLLYHPQFLELRHATSKLKEGPSFHAKRSERRVSYGSGDEKNSQSDQVDDSLVLKGLVAVGLLAYTGIYLKPREVALGVRKVLELLMSQIDLKVSLGKDPQQFSHLLSQASSLEDKVFSWAHDLRRFETAAIVSPRALESVSSSLCKDGENSFPTAAKIDLTGNKTLVETSTLQGLVKEHVGCILKPAAKDLLKKDGNCVIFSPLHSVDQQGIATCSPNNALSGLHGSLGNTNINYGLRDQPPGLNDLNHHQGKLASHSVTPAGSINCCPECLHRVKHKLRKLYIKSWRHSGSVLSLNAAEDIIGTCSAAIHGALNRSLGILEGDVVKGTYECTALTHEKLCGCKIKQKLDINGTSSVVSKVNGQQKLSDRIRIDDFVVADNLDISEDLPTAGFVCLCPLVKVITDLN